MRTIQNFSVCIFFSQSCLLAFQVDILYQNHMYKYWMAKILKKIYTSSPSPQLHTPLCHVKETDQPWASIINIVDYISFTCIIHFFYRGQLSVSFFFARLYILVCIFDPPVRMIILSSFFARSDDFIFGCWCLFITSVSDLIDWYSRSISKGTSIFIWKLLSNRCLLCRKVKGISCWIFLYHSDISLFCISSFLMKNFPCSC